MDNKNNVQASYLESEQHVTISISGEFTFSSVSHFRQSYEAQPIVDRYTLDLSQVTKFDSAGLGCILVMYEFIKHNNKQADLSICTANREILNIFECAKISHLLDDIQFHFNAPEFA